MAACRGFFECLLRLLNFILTVAGLAMVGYGIYLLVEWMKISEDGIGGASTAEVLVSGRPLLGAVILGDSFLDNLPKAWFIYLFIGVGTIVILVSLFGCIGAGTRNTCCLCFNSSSRGNKIITISAAQKTFRPRHLAFYNDRVTVLHACFLLLVNKYAFLVILLILAEAAAAAFIFFDHGWKDVIPVDKTHNFDVMYDFLKENWEIARWVALGVVVFEAVLLLLALAVRAMNKPAEYDSDDEIIAIGRSPTIRQPLIHTQNVPATGVPVPTLDQRASRNDAWSQRMREKYGLDTSQFTYNPSDPSRYQQNGTPRAEERSRCTIM
ncbi:hypothetical protein Zm00014a_041892 [Zea mays]|uniref:Tobamovirus multiplication protein 2A n=1 Tax=Zea mays TaxID=4577 RepID=A0A3L6DB39_MAIZE|nr:Tobamovirus multiplication protein 2A [Zea mays]PWZ05816.1 hypothetical protein Zm00014a_041892 [Zea mays]